MQQNVDFGQLGRKHLREDSYGAAVFCLYQAIGENKFAVEHWNGLMLSLSLMRKEADTQTMLARYALTNELPFLKDSITFAMMMWKSQPGVLTEWIEKLLTKQGITAEDHTYLKQIADHLKTTQQETQQPAEGVEAEPVTLQTLADRRLEIEFLLSETSDVMFSRLEKWIENEEQTMTVIRMLCLLPHARSEKILRRVCRNEDIEEKARTHALLALRWLGIRSKVKLNKFGEEFIVDLANPDPELTLSVPSAFRPALDHMKLWLACQQGHVSQEAYDALADVDKDVISDELKEAMKQSEFPAILQEVAHAVLRAAYDKYYPLVPHVTQAREWSIALLMLIKEYVAALKQPWPFQELAPSETAIQHRNWLLSGSPDFYDSLEEMSSLMNK